MLTGKQRSKLRSLANTMKPIFQIGKIGIEDNFLKQIEEALNARELIKVKVLNASGITSREASEIICEEIKDCEPIQCIGNKLVLYKKNKKNPKIEVL